MTGPVTRQVLADHQLPATLPVRHVEIRRITMGPGVAPGAHTHNGPVFGVIERGSVYFQIEDAPQTVLRAGDTFYEPADVLISRFDATDEGVQFLGYFPLQADQESELIPID